MAKAWPPMEWRDSHVLLAVSAGPDSVAMLRAVSALKDREGGDGKLFVAHLNHHLREPDSDIDQQWLKNLCATMELPLEVGHADVNARALEQGDGIEAAARAARYEFLQTAAGRLGARFVATAHTSDDQVETVLHRLLRGTGLAGLSGMGRIRLLSSSAILVRPLLGMRRQTLLEYLACLQQDYRIDLSNFDPRHTRSRLRHELLPALRQDFNPQVDLALLRLSSQAREAQQLIDALATDLVEQSVEFEPARDRLISEVGLSAVLVRVRIEGTPLAHQSPLLLREVFKTAWIRAGWPLQSMGYQEWERLAGLVGPGGESSPVNLPGNIQASLSGGLVVLKRLDY